MPQQQIIMTDFIELVYMHAFDYMRHRGFMQAVRVTDVQEEAQIDRECDCCGSSCSIITSIFYLDVDGKQQFFDYDGSLINMLQERIS